MEERKRKIDELWHRHGYASLNIALESSSGSSSSEEEEAGGPEEKFLDMVPPVNDIHYLIGDVTQPQQAGELDAIVVWCAGGCGHGCGFAVTIATSQCRQLWPVGEAGRVCCPLRSLSPAAAALRAGREDERSEWSWSLLLPQPLSLPPDLHLGDVHLISIDDRLSRDKGKDLVRW